MGDSVPVIIVDTHGIKALAKTEAMWEVVCYQIAVFAFILLYWFHKPLPKEGLSTAGGTRERAESDHNVKSKTSSSLRSKTKSRLSLLRKRKDLVERSIITELGLKPDEKGFEAFCDKFNNFELVSQALVQAGFCSCNVVIGIDFTASNEWQGKRTFSKHCLHKTNGSKIYNPYQKVLNIIGRTLSFISHDHLIYAYGFGDEATKDQSVFSLHQDSTAFTNYNQVIEAYTKAARNVKLSGPTNFAPIINKAVALCELTKQYHVLIVIVDGQVSAKCEQATVEAIENASNHPLSIITIGVGDGPFGTMFEYDDGLPIRKFDNLQFVNFHRTVTKSKHEAAFALHALMEIPDQYKAICQLGYLKSEYMKNKCE